MFSLIEALEIELKRVREIQQSGKNSREDEKKLK